MVTRGTLRAEIDPSCRMASQTPDKLFTAHLKQVMLGLLAATWLLGLAIAQTAGATPQDCSARPGDPDTTCLLYTSPSPRDRTRSRMPSSA